MNKDDARLIDMLISANKIRAFITSISEASYLKSELLQSAIERQIFILGEAANAVTQETRDKHPQIAWRSMIGMRNILAHQYGDVDQQIVWTTASQDVPALADYLKSISVPESHT